MSEDKDLIKALSDMGKKAIGKEDKKALSDKELTELKKLVGKVKTGEVVLFKEKKEKAARNLKRAGLLKENEGVAKPCKCKDCKCKEKKK